MCAWCVRPGNSDNCGAGFGFWACGLRLGCLPTKCLWGHWLASTWQYSLVTINLAKTNRNPLCTVTFMMFILKPGVRMFDAPDVTFILIPRPCLMELLFWFLLAVTLRSSHILKQQQVKPHKWETSSKVRIVSYTWFFTIYCFLTTMFSWCGALRGAKRASIWNLQYFRLKPKMSQETATSSDDAKRDQSACLLELFQRQKHMANPGMTAGPPCTDVCSQLAEQ